jgi:hypothetical protein
LRNPITGNRLLLRPRRERPRGAAEQHDQLAPMELIEWASRPQ